MHATSYMVLSLERSLSISAVGYLHSSGSVLADSCVKGCTVYAHTFVCIMFYAQRQALNRPLLQHVSACYTHKSCWILLGLGRVKPTGVAICAHTFVRINLYAQDHTALSCCRSLLQACYKVNSGAGYCLALGQWHLRALLFARVLCA